MHWSVRSGPRLIATLVVAIAALPTSSPAQQAPQTQTFTSTFSAAASSRLWSQLLAPGFYRVTYSSAQSAAVIELSVNSRIFSRSGPAKSYASLMVFREDSSSDEQTRDVVPPGLCTPEGKCDAQKTYLELARPETVTIRAQRAGASNETARFQITVERLQPPAAVRALAVGPPTLGYLDVNVHAGDGDPRAEYELALPPGRRYGVLVSSPDFTSILQIQQNQKTIAATSNFNHYVDQCNVVSIDGLPKFEALGETLSYTTVRSARGETFRVVVTSKVPTETGLFSIRIFDLTTLKLNVYDQLRFGTLTADLTSDAFQLVVPPDFDVGRELLEAHSDFPITMTLKDRTGAVIRTGKAERGEDSETEMPFRLSLMHSSRIELAGLDRATLVDSTIEVKGREPIDGQTFLVGAWAWGACGGGAIDPIVIVYPNVKDFTDQGYPIQFRGASLGQIQALIYKVTRHNLGWFFLLQCSADESKDPVDLVSSYTRLTPTTRTFTSLLVDYQVAVRVRYSRGSGAVTIWTRVERRGYKQSDWRIDPTETAMAQDKLVAQLRVTQPALALNVDEPATPP